MSTPMDTFESFSFPKPINDAIKKMGFEKPTPIQEKSIPLAIEGKDIVSMAQTGSGKTAAYLIPTLVRTLIQTEAQQKKQVLILVPTRELAMQTMEVARNLTWFVPQVKSVVLIGGASMQLQMRNLKMRPRFIVATPGRLMDHFRRRTVDLKNVDTLILDEADRMFDMGFAPQVKEIVKHIPENRHTMMFSATFPKDVRDLAQKILKNPTDISVKSDIAPPKINQKSIELSQDAKNETALDLINAATGSVLVFARTKSRTDRLGRYLSEYGVKVAVIHGDRSQGQRNQALQGFKSGAFKVLVATDIAARGIDVSTVSDVINFDLPEQYEDYVHRIGRTGRAGREGTATSLVTREDRGKWNMIARKSGAAPTAGADRGDERSGRGGSRGPSRGGPRGPRRFDDRRSDDRRSESRGPRRFDGPRSDAPRRDYRNDGPRAERVERTERPARSFAPRKDKYADLRESRSPEDREQAANKRPDHRNLHFKEDKPDRSFKKNEDFKKPFAKKPWQKMAEGKKFDGPKREGRGGSVKRAARSENF